MTNDTRRTAAMLAVQTVMAAIVCTMVGATAQEADRSTDDLAIYSAILDHTIRPEIARLSGKDGTRPLALVFDRTVAICVGLRRQPHIGCVGEETIQRLEGGSSRGRQTFEKLLAPEVREQMARDFRIRNADNHPLVAARLADVILFPPERLDETLKQHAGQTLGYSTFSQPGYSRDGRAIVYGSYTCGGLCGYGWFFLLEQRGGSWEVAADEMLWIS